MSGTRFSGATIHELRAAAPRLMTKRLRVMGTIEVGSLLMRVTVGSFGAKVNIKTCTLRFRA